MRQKLLILFAIPLLTACSWWAETSNQPIQGIASPSQEMPISEQTVFYPSQDINYPQQTSQPIEVENDE